MIYIPIACAHGAPYSPYDASFPGESFRNHYNREYELKMNGLSVMRVVVADCVSYVGTEIEHGVERWTGLELLHQWEVREKLELNRILDWFPRPAIGDPLRYPLYWSKEIESRIAELDCKICGKPRREWKFSYSTYRSIPQKFERRMDGICPSHHRSVVKLLQGEEECLKKAKLQMKEIRKLLRDNRVASLSQIEG